MTCIMNPSGILRLVEDMLPAPVIWLDRKRFLILIERHLIVINSDLYILSWYTGLHHSTDKCVNGHSSIEDIIDYKNLLPLLEVLWRPCPSIDINMGGMLFHIPIGTGNNCCIEYRSLAFLHCNELVILTHHIRHIRAAAK